MKSSSFEIIVAKDVSNGIGKDNSIPWNFPIDMNHFKKVTTRVEDLEKKNAIIMGRRTFESIGKTLPNRLNIVVTGKSLDSNDHLVYVKNIEDSVKYVQSRDDIETAFVIGGGMIYKEFITHPICTKLHVTNIRREFKCDTFFPDIPSKYDLIHSNTVDECVFEIFEYSNKDENGYLDLVRNILKNGSPRGDRTGTGTLSTFGECIKFDLSNNTLPLLTTKKVFTKGVFQELLWMISGDTSSKTLEKNGVNIWKWNSTREFLDKRGLSYKEGDLGPVYGFNWRFFGAKYIDSATDYTGQGVDQLQNCIDMIMNDPTSRRIIMTAWNPSVLDEMSLPPCHAFVQFYVNGDKLSCSLTQRSADIGLGSPFNIASYALLTHMIAKITNLKADKFVYFLGDAHIYNNHLDKMKDMISRKARSFPKIKFSGHQSRIEDFKYENIHVEGYYPHPKIQMDFST